MQPHELLPEEQEGQHDCVQAQQADEAGLHGQGAHVEPLVGQQGDDVARHGGAAVDLLGLCVCACVRVCVQACKKAGVRDAPSAGHAMAHGCVCACA